MPSYDTPDISFALLVGYRTRGWPDSTDSLDARRRDRARVREQPSHRRSSRARGRGASGGERAPTWRANRSSAPAPVTRARITSPSSRFRSRTALASWCIRTFPTTSCRACRFSGRSTPPAASTRSSARRSPKRRRPAPISKPTRADLRLEIVRAYWAAATAREASPGARRIRGPRREAADRCAAAIRCRTDSTERSVEPRSAAIARTGAADRGDEYSRVRADRPAPPDRRAA